MSTTIQLPEALLHDITRRESERDRSLALDVAAHLDLPLPRAPLIVLASDADPAREKSVVDRVQSTLADTGRPVTRFHAGLQVIGAAEFDSGSVVIIEGAHLALLPEHWTREPPVPTLLVLGIEDCASLATHVIPAVALPLHAAFDWQRGDLPALLALAGEPGLLLAALRVPLPTGLIGNSRITNLQGADAGRNVALYGSTAAVIGVGARQRREILDNLGLAGIRDALLQLVERQPSLGLPTLLGLVRALTLASRQRVLVALAPALTGALTQAAGEDLEARAVAARTLLEAGLIDEATSLLEGADVSRTVVVLAQAYIEFARAGGYAARKMLSGHSGPGAEWLRAMLPCNAGDGDACSDAAEARRAILARDPGNPGALALEAQDAARRGQRERCETALHTANKAAIGSGALLAIWAEARATLGDLEGALERVECAESAETWNPCHRLVRAEIALRRNEPTQAAEILRNEALALVQGWPPALGLLAEAEARLGDWNAARQCAAALGETANCVLTNARLEALGGRIGAGLRYLREALTQTPGQRDLRDAALDLLVRAGRCVTVVFAPLTLGTDAPGALAASAAPSADVPGWQVAELGDTRLALTVSPAQRAVVTVETNGRPAAGVGVLLLAVTAGGETARRAIALTDAAGDADVGPANLVVDFLRGDEGCRIEVLLPPDAAASS